MKKSEKDLIETVSKAVSTLIAENPYGHSKGIETIAENIEKNRVFRIKDFEYGINYYMTKELSVYKNESDKDLIKKETLLYETCKQVIEQSVKLRRERNKETSKIDTNLLTHAPYFVGGSHKRKRQGREEGYIYIDKEGLRKLTYENEMGYLLTMVDAQTLFGLFSIWEEQGYQQWVTFTEYKLLNKLNMKDGGTQYKKLRNSLEKLRNTSIVMREAYNNDKGIREVTERFKLIIADKFTTDYDNKGTIRSKTYEIQFSPYIDSSMKSGYYSLISLAVFNELEIGIAQGLYLMFTGINNMDKNESYLKDRDKYEISLEEIYETLFIESDRHKRKGMVEKGCEELKEVGVIEEYHFVKKEKEYLILKPTEWQLNLLKKKEQQLETQE